MFSHSSLTLCPRITFPSLYYTLSNLSGMLRSSSWMIHPAVRRTSPTTIRSLCGLNHKYLSNTRSSLPSFSSRTYTSAATLPPKRKTWKWIVAPAVVIGVGYLLSQKDEDSKDERFNTEKLYASKSTTELAFSWVILKLCSYDLVVNYGPKLLHWAEKYPSLKLYT